MSPKSPAQDDDEGVAADDETLRSGRADDEDDSHGEQRAERENLGEPEPLLGEPLGGGLPRELRELRDDRSDSGLGSVGSLRCSSSEERSGSRSSADEASTTAGVPLHQGGAHPHGPGPGPGHPTTGPGPGLAGLQARPLPLPAPAADAARGVWRDPTAPHVDIRHVQSVQHQSLLMSGVAGRGGPPPHGAAPPSAGHGPALGLGLSPSLASGLAYGHGAHPAHAAHAAHGAHAAAGLSAEALWKAAAARGYPHLLAQHEAAASYERIVR